MPTTTEARGFWCIPYSTSSFSLVGLGDLDASEKAPSRNGH
jgi:hypothetical protein